ncbi:hypothetical protein ACHAXA_009925 [Cyclostephanos tholiformis]|uniref:Uncharacterized protein n=1 Tax=Cyclostephanos tholiformis TaxID=382380 RepID=A0ABD3RXW8_9STRA
MGETTVLKLTGDHEMTGSRGDGSNPMNPGQRRSRKSPGWPSTTRRDMINPTDLRSLGTLGAGDGDSVGGRNLSEVAGPKISPSKRKKMLVTALPTMKPLGRRGRQHGTGSRESDRFTVPLDLRSGVEV